MHRSPSPLLLVLALVVGCSGGGEGTGDFEPFARAFRATDREQLVGGPLATAAVGDLVLENDRIRVAVVAAFESVGANLFGGGLVDADLNRPSVEGRIQSGRDELGEIFPIVDLQVQRPDAPGEVTRGVETLATSVNVLEPGGRGADARAVVRVEAVPTPFLAVTGIIPVEIAADLRLVQDYILEPGDPFVTIRTELQYRPPGAGDAPFVPSRRFEIAYRDEPVGLLGIGADVLFGQLVGDIALLGGATTLFAPQFGFDSFGFGLQPNPSPTPDMPFDELRPFRNTFADPIAGDLFVGVGALSSYGMTTREGIMSIPILADPVVPQLYGSSRRVVELATGQPFDGPAGEIGDAIVFERYLIVGEGDVGSVRDVAYGLRGTPVGRVEGHAVEEVSGRALSGASVLVFEHPRDGSGALSDPASLTLAELGAPLSQLETDVRHDDTRADGSFATSLPPGDYLLLGLSAGRGRSRPTPVSVRVGETTRRDVLVPRTGRLRVTVRDAQGGGSATIPAKITVVELDGKGVPWPRFGEGSLPIARIPRPNAIYEPQTVDAARGDLEFIAAYRHTAGSHTFELDPGRYRVYASHGYEYTIDLAEVTVRPGLEEVVELSLAHVVDTTGWISADFHVHSHSSSDASCPKERRAIGYPAEGVELLTSTDHDYVTNYAPFIEEAGMREWVTTMVGVELTTFETGHYNGYPLVFDRTKPANGAPGWFDLSVPQIFDTLRSRGKYGPDRTVTQANHPRSSSNGYFSQFAFDQGTAVICGDNFLSFGNPAIRDGFFGPVKTENFCLDCFMTMEAINGKRHEQMRTPTLAEIPPTLPGQTEPLPPVPLYDILARTMAEQRRILDPDDPLALDDSSSLQGAIDDFFGLLNLGLRPTLVANSDSHGCSDMARTRTWIEVGTDVPSAVDELDVVAALARQKAVAGYGAFLSFSIQGAGLGETVTDTDGVVDLSIRAQGPGWFDLDRIEIYGNGELVREIPVERPSRSVDKFDGVVSVDVRDVSLNGGRARDTWFVVVALGDDDLFPVNFPQSEPSGDAFSDALSTIIPGSVSNSFPRVFNLPPYAITNPIYVDVDGDGAFTAIGRPPDNGRFKLEQCAGAARPEDCACAGIEVAEDELDELLEALDLLRFYERVRFTHGRLAAVPTSSAELAALPTR